jgi:hypothetical protein
MAAWNSPMDVLLCVEGLIMARFIHSKLTTRVLLRLVFTKTSYYNSNPETLKPGVIIHYSDRYFPLHALPKLF